MCCVRILTFFILPKTKASTHLFALAVAYLLLLVAAFAQLWRLKRFSALRSQISLAEKRLDAVVLQHAAIGVACFLRATLLVASNALASRPALIVLMSQLPATVQIAVFLNLALAWCKAGIFTFAFQAQKRVDVVGKAVFLLSLLTCLGFPLALLVASEESKSKLATLGAYCCGAVGLSLACGLLLFGLRLGNTLQKAHRSQQSLGLSNEPGASNSIEMSLGQKVKRATLVFTVCFACEGLLTILAVGENALFDETANVALPLLFGSLPLHILPAINE